MYPYLAPGLSPAVLNDIEIFSVLRSISDEEHTVVEALSASGVIEDTIEH